MMAIVRADRQLKSMWSMLGKWKEVNAGVSEEVLIKYYRHKHHHKVVRYFVVGFFLEDP